MNSPKNNSQDKEALISRWEHSGKGILQFCKEENILYHYFLYWRRKLRKQKPSARFIRLKQSGTEFFQNPSVEIILSNGNRISFNHIPEAGLIKQLAR